MLRRLGTNTDNLHLALMLALTFSTGVVDAVGYLGLDRVFTGNMTGNVVILGMALAGGDGLPIIGPIIALLSFMLGAVIAGRVLRPITKGWTHRSTSLLTAVAVLMVALAVTLMVFGGTPPKPQEYVVTLFLALAMGIQAGTARHIAVKDVTTVVVTSTITGFAADSRLAGGKGQPWIRRGSAIVLIAAGAAVGALLLRLGLGWGVSLSALITVGVAVLGHVGTRHSANSPEPEVSLPASPHPRS
ncbi:YoaK family protein [Subtercola vilae]|nr:YoaK family protein [Subtercola vilae]